MFSVLHCYILAVDDVMTAFEFTQRSAVQRLAPQKLQYACPAAGRRPQAVQKQYEVAHTSD